MSFKKVVLYFYVCNNRGKAEPCEKHRCGHRRDEKKERIFRKFRVYSHMGIRTLVFSLRYRGLFSAAFHKQLI